MGWKQVAEEARPVYQKDLYDDHHSMTVRVDTGDLEHGDQLRVRVEKLITEEEEGSSDDLREAPTESWLDYIIRALQGF